MTAIEKMVVELERELASHEDRYGRELTRHHLDKALRLADEEEAQKPKAPASLVDKKSSGLFMKYHVERVDGKPIPEGCIVLEWKDRNALTGISAFSRAVRQGGYVALADDLDKRLSDKGYRPASQTTDEGLREACEGLLNYVYEKHGATKDTLTCPHMKKIAHILAHPSPVAPQGFVEDMEMLLSALLTEEISARGDSGLPNEKSILITSIMERMGEIISRHKGSKPAEKGYHDVEKFFEDSSPAKAEEPMLKTPPEFEKIFHENVGKMYATGPEQINIEEPLALDSTGCCPKCGLLLKDMSHESLAVLADRKGYGIEVGKAEDGHWGLGLTWADNEGKHMEGFEYDTYPEAEAKARAFLNGLPDVKKED